MGKCEHGLTTKECMVCASPKYGEERTSANAEQRFKDWFERCAHPLRRDERLAASVVWSACESLTERRIIKAMNDKFEAIERTMYLRGDALEFAGYLATQAEALLTALEYEDMARVAWDESGAGTPEFERWGRATDSRGEHARMLRSRIYEFTKRIPHDPHYPCRHDGRCQYAIDHGVEGMGHCQAGKCAMPEGA